MKEPKEKAEELISKFKPHADWNNDYGSAEKQANVKHAIQCALIAVEEIIEAYSTTVETWHNSKGLNLAHVDNRKYWQEVKTHLQNKE